jgi:threonine/homoserine/homoserine lactone efflux protein
MLIVGFILAILPLIVTPGASLTLLGQRVGEAGMRAARPVIGGTVTGLYVHATLAAVGLSAVVMRSSELFAAVRLAGAAYLIVLGISILRPRAPRPARPMRTGRSTYLQALLGNVLNPKAASIFLTLVPQFVDPRRPVVPQILVLASVQASLVTIWLFGWAVAITRARASAATGRWAATVRRVTGGMLIALGLRAAIG